jgi:hypothetical protein
LRTCEGISALEAASSLQLGQMRRANRCALTPTSEAEMMNGSTPISRKAQHGFDCRVDVQR